MFGCLLLSLFMWYAHSWGAANGLWPEYTRHEVHLNRRGVISTAHCIIQICFPAATGGHWNGESNSPDPGRFGTSGGSFFTVGISLWDIQQLEERKKLSFFLKLGCLAEVSLEKLSSAIHTVSRVRVRHGKLKKWTAGTANVHTHGDTHGLFELYTHATRGQTPSFSIEEQPPLELPLFLSQQKWGFLQTWVVSSMPSPGSVSSIMRGTALKEQRWGPVDQVGHMQRDEGQFDNDDKATNQKNVHLIRMKPALLSPRFLFLPKETHQTSLTELHATPYRLDTKPDLKQSVRTRIKQLWAFWISVAPVDSLICKQVELMRLQNEWILV